MTTTATNPDFAALMQRAASLYADFQCRPFRGGEAALTFAFHDVADAITHAVGGARPDRTAHMNVAALAIALCRVRNAAESALRGTNDVELERLRAAADELASEVNEHHIAVAQHSLTAP